MGLPLVEKLIVPEKNMDPERQEIGFYRFNFFWFGQWNPVWVDDYVRTGYIDVGDIVLVTNLNCVTNIRITFRSPRKDGVSIPKMLRIKLNRENLDGGICFSLRQGSTDRLDDSYQLNISRLIPGSGPNQILSST